MLHPKTVTQLSTNPARRRATCSPVSTPKTWAEPVKSCNRNDFNCYEFYWHPCI